jgi:hypothetical protein
VSTKTRKSLHPENLEKMVFLQKNFPLINHDY